MRRRRLTWRSPAARWLLATAVLAFVGVGALWVVGLINAQSMPVLRRVNLHMPGFPKDVPPARVALLADIHLGNRAMQPEHLDAIVDEVNASHPDIVLIAGDFVVGHGEEGALERAAGLTAPLKRLQAPLGVVAVLGNHDHWTGPNAVSSALGRAGITILENQVVQRGPFAIMGIGDRFSGYDDVSATLAAGRAIAGFPIVLTHSPDLVPDLPSDQPLVLAGHTHCGQVVLPWLGPLVMHAPTNHWWQLYNPRYRCGIVSDGGRLTIVTAGVGSGTAPIRIGAMPDWWLITIEHGTL